MESLIPVVFLEFCSDLFALAVRLLDMPKIYNLDELLADMLIKLCSGASSSWSSRGSVFWRFKCNRIKGVSVQNMSDASAKTQIIMDGGGDMAALPEDVLIEILSRVGSIKSHFRLAVTCRHWLRRFTDPSFLRLLCPSHGKDAHHARLLGFLFQKDSFVRCERLITSREAQRGSVSPPAFLPSPGSPLGRTDRALTSFVADDGGDFNYAEPIASRRGIVLMRLVPRAVRTIDTTHLLLGVCSPITGDRHVLQPLERDHDTGYHLIGFAIITAADIDDDDENSGRRFAFSKLLVTTRGRNEFRVYLHAYSVTTRSWTTPTLCLDDRRFSLAGESSAVVRRGVAHWLYSDSGNACILTRDDSLYKLSVDARDDTSSRVSLTKLPFCAGGSPFMGITSGGKLSVACMFPVHARVWTEEDDDGTWVRSVIRMPMATPHQDYQILYEKWYGFDRGSMLLMYRSNGIGVFILDLEKKVMEKVMDCFVDLSDDRLDRIETPVAYEMDLVEFFVLQLGGLRRDLQGI
uniref:F-box domain-containing protein n=1 Tax=Leersia perrieri TaxID=77586 RepID=A0A0D9UWU3_9ORYZ